MAFEELASFTKDVSDLADKPALGSAAALKAQFDAAPEEVRVYLNKLIKALKLTTAGDSGAKNIGATTINGLTGNDVQTLLENLYKKITVLDPWANVTTQNGWQHHASYPCQYYKDPSGVVHLRGILTPGLLTSGIVPLLLPEGFRPARRVDLITKMVSSTSVSYTTLIFEPSGNVSVHDNMNIAALYFDNIQFRTDS